MKFKTVYEGQKALIRNHIGEGRVVEGPQRVFLFRERFRFLKSHKADRYNYIRAQANDGEITNIPGPCEVFSNPLVYRECSVEGAELVDANHLLVVYRRLKSDQSERRIIEGPAVFVPSAGEWIHSFSWHGTDPSDKARMIPANNKFTHLPTIPDNFYYNVREVRTSDDTMITVKLMLFYAMDDILKMLDASHDPIADLINALCADVISFVGPLSYSQFVSKTKHLSLLETYPQLLQRAARIGFTILKVVYRGYHAPEQLQTMQNEAIETRTALRLEKEIEDQKQRLTDFKLMKQQERREKEQMMAAKKQSHEQRLSKLKQDHKLEVDEMKLQQRLELASLRTQIELEHKAAKDEHNSDHLGNLNQLGVDLNKFLTLNLDPPATEELRIKSAKHIK